MFLSLPGLHPYSETDRYLLTSQLIWIVVNEDHGSKTPNIQVSVSEDRGERSKISIWAVVSSLKGKPWKTGLMGYWKVWRM